MRYASIRDMDISNGTGVGAAIFFQGCSIHCKNCFQPQTWDFNGGKEWTDETTKELFQILSKSYIKRLTLLGGEPLDQAHELNCLLIKIKEKFPNLQIWIYSGRTFEENIAYNDGNENFWKKMCLLQCDVLVDGKFIDEQKDLTLKFRGSKNQRVIDLKKTFENGKIELFLQ